MKKVLCLLSVALMCCTLFACGKSEPVAEDPETTLAQTIEEEEETVPEEEEPVEETETYESAQEEETPRRTKVKMDTPENMYRAFLNSPDASNILSFYDKEYSGYAIVNITGSDTPVMIVNGGGSVLLFFSIEGDEVVRGDSDAACGWVSESFVSNGKIYAISHNGAPSVERIHEVTMENGEFVRTELVAHYCSVEGMREEDLFVKGDEDDETDISEQEYNAVMEQVRGGREVEFTAFA